MATYDLEDEDELDAGLGLDGMEGGIPNMPRNPDADPRQAKMKEYLSRQRMGGGGIDELRSSDRDMAFINLLNQSANQVGTLGGKAASGAPLQDFTRQMQAGNQAMVGDIQKDRAMAEADQDRQLKMKQYLQKQKNEEAKMDATAGYRKDMLGLKREQIEAGREKAELAATKEKAPTSDERKFGAFAERAQSANDAYEAYIQEHPTAKQLGTKDYLVGKYGGEIGSGMMSDEAKMSKQLEKEFIGSVLRPETGAAASDDEWAMYGAKYFPRVNDTPEMLERKANIRKQDIGTMRTIAGKGATAAQPTAVVSTPTTTSGTKQTPPAVGASSGGLSPDEQAELDELERQYGGQ